MFILPWRLMTDQNRYRFQVGKWIGLVDWWNGASVGNWALWRGDDLIASGISKTVDQARLAVEDAYIGVMTGN